MTARLTPWVSALFESVLKYFRRHGTAGAGGANEYADLMLMPALCLYPRAQRALYEYALPSPLDTIQGGRQDLTPAPGKVMQMQIG